MTFFIQTGVMIAFVTGIKPDQVRIISKHVVEISDNCAIETCLSNLLNDICTSLALNQQQIIYRVIVLDNQVMQHSLQLPNIGLKPYDIESYIKNSLTKIFNTPQSLAYDYLITAHNDKYLTLAIYVYPQILIQHFVQIFSQHQLNFVGIDKHLLESEQHELMFEQLASTAEIQGINFLPWRQAAKKAKTKLFLTVVISGVTLLSLIMLCLFGQMSQQQNQQRASNEQLRAQLFETNLQLSSLIDLDKKITQLQSEISMQQQLQKQLLSVIDDLIIVTNTVPDGVWFNGLSYHDNNISLKGESFLYRDIVAFSRLLHQNDIIDHAKIVSVKKYYDLLQFDIVIQFVKSD